MAEGDGAVYIACTAASHGQRRGYARSVERRWGVLPLPATLLLSSFQGARAREKGQRHLAPLSTQYWFNCTRKLGSSSSLPRAQRRGVCPRKRVSAVMARRSFFGDEETHPSARCDKGEEKVVGKILKISGTAKGGRRVLSGLGGRARQPVRLCTLLWDHPLFSGDVMKRPKGSGMICQCPLVSVAEGVQL